MKCLRPDRLIQITMTFASLAFETDLAVKPEYELGQIIAGEIQSSTPMYLVSIPGYDASY